MGKIRCFVALELDQSIKEAVGRASGKLRRAGGDVRWVRPENLHMTLRFVGEVEEAVVEGLRTAISTAIRDVSPFKIRLAGTGRFPESGRRIRVVWIGCTEGRESLKKLWDRVQGAARQSGLPRDDKGFSPHITIGRVKSPRGIENLAAALGKLQNTEFGDQAVERIVLMQSRLQPTGAVYTPIETFPLGAGSES